MPDPVTGQPRAFNDLGRRRADLRALVCPDDMMPPPTGMGGTGGSTGTGGRGGSGGRGAPGGTTGTTGTGGVGGKGATSTAPLLPAMPIGTLTKGIGRVH